MSYDFKKLSEPFPPDAIEWRVGQVSANGNSATLLAYITSRAVMDRLDDVVGPDNWQDDYVDLPKGGVQCRLSIRCGDEWVTKVDAADPTQIEATKGGRSDAFKRAAVKWGIGRYLYSLPTCRQPRIAGWPREGVSISAKKSGEREPFHCMIPTLPAWALPAGTKRADEVATARKSETPAQTAQRQAGHDADWPANRAGFCAAVGPYGGYDAVKALCEAKGWGAPSTWTEDRRRSFVAKLQSDETLAAAVKERA